MQYHEIYIVLCVESRISFRLVDRNLLDKKIARRYNLDVKELLNEWLCWFLNINHS